MVLDAKRASLHADALTETYVTPPHLRDSEICWLLKKCMYGTLPAAAGWQHLVQKVGADIGLLSSSSCPCTFGHASRDLDIVVDGDDFIVAGCGDDLDWLSQSEREARAGAESKIGTWLRQRGNCVETLRDVQRLWTDVGGRPATRSAGSGRAWTSVGTSTDEPWRRHAERTTGPRGAGA